MRQALRLHRLQVRQDQLRRPAYGQVDDYTIFDLAYFKVQIKKSQSGTDPVKKSKNFYGIENKLEDSASNGNYNNSYTTGTISYKIGSSKGLGDGELHLDWDSDGGGDQKHLFSASPTVLPDRRAPCHAHAVSLPSLAWGERPGGREATRVSS